MNGQLFPQKTNMASVDIEVEHKWLHSSHLRFDTESLICTSQEQALETNVKKEKIWKQGCSSMYSLCHKQEETNIHMVSGCEMLCGTKYFYIHNIILSHIYTG